MVDLVSISTDEAGVALSARACDHQEIDLLAPDPIVEHVDDCHDFPEGLFDDYVFVRASRKQIRIASPPLDIPPEPDVDRVGLEFLRIDMATPRLTTVAAMTWGRYARRNAVDLDPDQSRRYLRREPIRLTDRQLESCTGRTFLMIRHRDHGLGAGFLESTRPNDDHYRRVRSLYPRAFASELATTSPFGNPD